MTEKEIKADAAAEILGDCDCAVKCPSCDKRVTQLSMWSGCWGRDGWCCDDCWSTRNMEE